MRKRLLGLLAILLLISVPAMAATAVGTLTLVSATISPGLNTQVVASQSIRGTTDDGGGDLVCATLWDDGTPKVSQCLSVPFGATQTLTWTLNSTGTILTGVAGVGLYVVDATSAATPTIGGAIGSIDPITPAQIGAGAPIPTMSEPALIAMALLVLLVGVVYAWRRGHGPPVA